MHTVQYSIVMLVGSFLSLFSFTNGGACMRVMVRTCSVYELVLGIQEGGHLCIL